MNRNYCIVPTPQRGNVAWALRRPVHSPAPDSVLLTPSHAPDPLLLLSHYDRAFVRTTVVVHHQIILELDHTGAQLDFGDRKSALEDLATPKYDRFDRLWLRRTGTGRAVITSYAAIRRGMTGEKEISFMLAGSMPCTISRLAEKVDVRWMLPDMAAVTRDSLESFFCIESGRVIGSAFD